MTSTQVRRSQYMASETYSRTSNMAATDNQTTTTTTTVNDYAEEEHQQTTEVIPSLQKDMDLKQKSIFATADSQLALTPTTKRKLVLDEDRFSETFLKCMICREAFDMDDLMPKMLPCHHTYCLHCLLEMFRVESEFRSQLTSAFRNHLPTAVKIQCPSCREGYILSESELRKLPTDKTILELTDFVTTAECCTVSYCVKHQSHPLSFFCESCMEAICSVCSSDSDHSTHEVININEALRKYNPEIESTLGQLATEAATVLEARESLVRAIKQLDAVKIEIINDIKATFDKFRVSADTRQQELIDMCETEINRKQRELRKKLAIVQKRERELQESRDLLHVAQEQEDVDQLFKQHKTLKASVAQDVELPSCSHQDFNALLQYSNNEEAGIVRSVSDFGNVIFETS